MSLQQQFVDAVLKGANYDLKPFGTAFAPSNIALCKYWGKRDFALNLPLTSSLSVSLGTLGTETCIHLLEGQADSIVLNGEMVPPEKPFAARMSAFLDLFRPTGKCFTVETKNNIPTAAGLASSASGFAALVLALDDLFDWDLSREKMSMLARLGSGSAARSVYEGFVVWHAGEGTDGLDSFAEPCPFTWPEFRIGILELCSGEKPVGSRSGMNRTVETSMLFKEWPEKVRHDLNRIEVAIASRDFELLGKTAESNALAMHATMLDAWPPLMYFQPESVAMMHRIWQLRADGLPLYFTMDAGPNLKLLFTAENEATVKEQFPELQTVSPFQK
jgi:diphosphomevalonate decarboxylase